MAKYTTPEQVDLSALAQHYALVRPMLTPLSGGAANSSFRLSADGTEFVLTVLDNHDASSARKLAAHTQAFFRLGIPTTEVVPAADGSLTVEIDGRPFVLKKWIEGEVRQPIPLALLPQVGRVLGELHALPTESPGLETVPVGTRRLSSEQRAAIPHFADGDFAAWLTRRLDRIRAVEAEHRRASTLVHGDLFEDNVIVRGDGRLSVLDWETVSLDDPLLDLGMAAVGLAQRHGALEPERLDALVKGYREVRPLAEADVTALPLEIEHAALIIAFHRYYRHNVRFPDASKSTLHVRMIKFVDTIEEASLALS